MTDRTQAHSLQVATELHLFINEQVLPGTGVAPEAFWKGFDAIVNDLAPRNAALLAERDRLQTELDTWHKAHPGPITDMAGYQQFLTQIGYLVEQPKDAKATTTNVDAELAIRSEEHTSELQSPCNLVCRLLLEKKKINKLMKRVNDDS